MSNGPTRPDGDRANKARHALRAMPNRNAALTFNLGTALWAVFRTVPA